MYIHHHVVTSSFTPHRRRMRVNLYTTEIPPSLIYLGTIMQFFLCGYRRSTKATFWLDREAESMRNTGVFLRQMNFYAFISERWTNTNYDNCTGREVWLCEGFHGQDKKRTQAPRTLLEPVFGSMETFPQVEILYEFYTQYKNADLKPLLRVK